MVGRNQPPYHTPDKEIRAKVVWTVQGPRSSGTGKLPIGTTVPLEDT